MTDLIQMGVLSLIALSCGLIGPFLVLKKMTMFANSLSHTILLGIALAFLVGGGQALGGVHLLVGAFFAAFLTAFLTEGLIRYFKLQEDASIGLVFTSLFALGIILVTVFMRDVHLGIEAVMGNADILQMSDLKMSAALALWNLGFIVLFYRPLKIVSFDQNLARSLGIAANFFHFMLLFLAAAVCISAFRAVGVLLVLSFLTGPFLTARLFSQKLKNLLILTPAIGISASILSVLLSRFVLQIFDLPLSTGGLTACLIGAIYAVSASLCGKKSKSRLDLAS